MATRTKTSRNATKAKRPAELATTTVIGAPPAAGQSSSQAKTGKGVPQQNSNSASVSKSLETVATRPKDTKQAEPETRKLPTPLKTSPAVNVTARDSSQTSPSTAPPQNKVNPSSADSVPVCKKYSTGCCKRQNCPDLHVKDAPSERLKQEPTSASDLLDVLSDVAQKQPTHRGTRKGVRKSKPVCWPYRRGQCNDANCPKRHPRSWGPEPSREESGDEETEDETERPAAEASRPIADVSRTADVAGVLTAVPTIPTNTLTRSSSTMQPQKRDKVANAARSNGGGKHLGKDPDDSQLDQREICRNYSKNRCKDPRCPRRHVEPLRRSKTREGDVQSEQQRQQLAVGAVDSVAAGPPPSVTQTRGAAAAEANRGISRTSRAPETSLSPLRPSTLQKAPLHPLPSAPVPSSLSPVAVSQSPASRKAAEESKGIGDPPSTNGDVCRFFLAGNCIVARCRHSHEQRKPAPLAPSPIAVAPMPFMVSASTELDHQSPLNHFPFSDEAEISMEASPLIHNINGLPPKPVGLSVKPGADISAQGEHPAPQDGRPTRKWVPDPRPSRRSDVMCLHYRRGTCSYGDDCYFTHTLAIDKRRARKKDEVCRLFVFGVCDWGENCQRMHISADSPTLVLPVQRPGPTQPANSEAPAAGTVPTSEAPDASGSEAVASRGSSVLDSQHLGIEQTRINMVRSRLNAIDNRPARRYPIICLDNLRGRCRNEEHCPRTHVLSGPNSSSMTSPLEKSHGLPPPPSERVGLACNAKSEPPAPTPSTRDVCMNWLFRDTCLNGASCMYEHPPKSGSMRPGPAVDVSSGTVTPMPTGGSNIRGYIPAESRQPESLNLGGAADVVTLSRTPERTVPSTNLHPDTTDRERRPQGTTAGDLLLDLRRNAKGSTHTSHSSASEKPGPSQIRLQQGEIPASTSTSTPYETAARDAFSALSHRAGGSSSYYEVYGLTFANLRASNVGPRLRQQRPESQGDHGGGVPAHTSRVNVPIEHAETSSDTSYYSAEYGSDPSVDAAQSSNTSFDLSQTPAEPSQPVCWDFLHGECTRHVCRFRHEEFDPRKETLSTERRRQVSGVRRSDTYPSRGDHTAKNSSTRIPGSTSSAGHHDTSHDLPKSDQPGRAEPFAAPALPPGLGLETRRPNPGLTAQRKEPPANITLSVLDSTRVTYGPGFVVQSVVTGFETRQVVLKDLPVDVTPADVTAVLKAHGEVASVYLPDPGKRGVATARVTFASSEQAVTAVSALDGTEVFGTTISARMWSGQSSLLGKARLADGDVLFEFPCAHKTGYIGYPSRALAEKAIAHANNTEVKGNWVTAEMHEGIPMVGAFTVRLRGLPASTQVKDLGRYGKSEGVMLERPNYDSSKVAIHRLRVILDNFGSMFSFNVLPPPYKRGTIRAYGQFETPAAAETVCAALHNRRQPFCGHGTLFATHISTLVYELPPAVFDALSSDIRLLNAFIWNTFEPGSSISIVDKRATVGPRCPVRVKLAAQRMPALTRMKSHFDRLLRGERVEQDGEIMWDSFFARRPGIFFLEELQRRHTGVLINRDIGRHILTLFGPEPKRAAVRSAIVSRVDELRRQNCHVIPLPGRLVGLFWGADLAALRRQFGEENVSLDPVARALKVRGDDVAHEAALLAVKQARERHVSERQQPQVECPVCFNEVTNPVKLGCGHTWCKTCLQSYLRASVDNTAFPLLCLGDEARCSSQVPIHIAQEVLSTNDFMSVVEASFRAYVHSRPSEYQYCPTPDCSQVYRRTSSNNTLQCPSCLVRICPKCNSEAHERSPCQYNEASDRLLFDDWKGSHDVKDCPSCKAPIEREAGCNHMMCIRCKTHICWACLATFDTSGEVYEHMRLIHGGIGL